MTRRERGWWIEQNGKAFRILGKGSPIKRGKGLDPHTFSGAIKGTEAHSALNFKDRITLRHDGARALQGFLEDIELDGDERQTIIKGSDDWIQTSWRSTRDERFVDEDVADIVRRALGLRYTVREPFDNQQQIQTLTQTRVTGGVLKLAADSLGVFPTAGAMEAISKNRGLAGEVQAVELTTDDRVGAEPEEVFEDLDDNSKSDGSETAFFDEARELIRLPSVRDQKTFPFDDYSQTEETTGSAIIQDGKLTLGGDLLDDDFEDEDLAGWTKDAEEWQDHDDIDNGLTTTDGIGRNEAFVLNGEQYLIQAMGADGWKGWQLNPADDEWDADIDIENGLAGIVAEPDGFVTWYDGATLYGIIIKQATDLVSDATLTGVRWNTGTSAWVTDSEATDGLSVAQISELDLARVDRLGDQYLIQAYRSYTRHYTDFSEYTTDQQPSDWTEVEAGTADWLVRADAGATGGKYLEGVGDGIAYRDLDWDDLNDVADAELLVTFRINDQNFSLQQILHARAGTVGTQTRQGYYFESTLDGTEIEIVRYTSGDTRTALGNATKTLTAGTWYKARFSLIGNALKLKVWANTSSEPAAWDIEVTDSTYTSGKWGTSLRFTPLPDAAGENDYDTFEADVVDSDLRFKAWKRNTGTGAWEASGLLDDGLANVTLTDNTALSRPHLSYAGIQGEDEEEHVLLLAFDNDGTWAHKAYDWNETTDTWAVDGSRWGSIGEDPKVSVAAFYWKTGRYAVASADSGGAFWLGYARSSLPILEAVGTGHGSFSAHVGGRGVARRTFAPLIVGTQQLDVYAYDGYEAHFGIGPDTFVFRITSTGIVQYRQSNGTYAALPTPTTVSLDAWHDIDLKWDTTDADPANWTCEILVDGGSKGEVGRYSSANREIGEVTLGYFAGNATELTHQAAFDDILTFAGHTQGALSGEWRSKQFTDPNVLHAIRLNPTQNKPSGSSIVWYYSQDNGTTWHEVPDVDLDTDITLPRTDADYKIRAVLSATSLPNAPDVTVLVVDHLYRYQTGQKTWSSIKLGDSGKPEKMRVDLVDINGDPAKALPAGTTIIIEVSPDGYSTNQEVAEGADATFDTDLTGAADWRVRFKLQTTNQNNTPEIQSFLLSVTFAGTNQTVTYYVSRDGSTFHEVLPGTPFSGFGAGESPKDQLYWKVVFTNDDDTSSPEVRELTMKVTTAGNMEGIVEGDINAFQLVTMESLLENYVDLLDRVERLTGIPIRRRFNPATGETEVDWNETPGGATIELDSEKVEGLKWRKSAAGQANRILYSGA